ncbi:MAG TPA: aldo/keto reductase, partial [Thalassobaculum sp.]
ALKFRPGFDYTYDAVMRSFEDSLQRLGLNRVDILLIHDLDADSIGSAEEAERHYRTLFSGPKGGGYRALAELREQGVVSAIGAGLNLWEVCERLARDGNFDAFLLAGRYTLLEQEALATFLPLCVEKGIGIILGGPYNSGILARGPVEGATWNYDPAPAAVMDRVRRIEAVCRRHGVPMAAAALQFPLHHPAVASVIPGGRSVREVTQNVETLGVAIPDALWADLKDEGLMRRGAPVS